VLIFIKSVLCLPCIACSNSIVPYLDSTYQIRMWVGTYAPGVCTYVSYVLSLLSVFFSPLFRIFYNTFRYVFRMW
jgi:hypothetical protein